MTAMDRRRVLGLFGAAAGAAVLAACGGDSSDSSSATTTTAGDTASTTTTTAGATTSTTASAGSATGSTTVTADLFDDAASCTLTPELTEGPYYLDVDSVRQDIREDREGVVLRVAARVLGTDGCTPVRDAVFEIWHCDAAGLYSGFESASQGGPGGGGGATDDERYLRGAQVTDADGIAVITTVYPGWYRGRTVHIHAKVHISNAEVLTTQLFFDDDLTDVVHADPPYEPGRDTLNRDDGIFAAETILTVREEGDGYLGLISLAVGA